jgi:hypothetical protein
VTRREMGMSGTTSGNNWKKSIYLLLRHKS